MANMSVIKSGPKSYFFFFFFWFNWRRLVVVPPLSGIHRVSGDRIAALGWMSAISVWGRQLPGLVFAVLHSVVKKVEYWLRQAFSFCLSFLYYPSLPSPPPPPPLFFFLIHTCWQFYACVRWSVAAGMGCVWRGRGAEGGDIYLSLRARACVTLHHFLRTDCKQIEVGDVNQ